MNALQSSVASIPDVLLAAAIAKTDALAAAGMHAGAAAGATALRVASQELRATIAAVPTGGALPPPTPPPATATTASTSPREVLIAQMRARLEALEASAGVAPATAGAGGVAAVVGASQTQYLSGMAALRLAGGTAAGDLQLFTDMGGAGLVERLATLTGNSKDKVPPPPRAAARHPLRRHRLSPLPLPLPAYPLQVRLDLDRDNFFSAQEALEYGMIDRVITPREVQL